MEVANRFGSAVEKLKDGASELGSAVADKSIALKDAAIEKGREAYQKSAQKVKEVHAKGETFIQANPYRSVLVAFGVGALIGVAATFVANRSRD